MAAPKEPPKHKHKSVPWRQDPDILKRLEIVANMMTQGAKNPQIAEALGTDLRTASRDTARVKELWRKASENMIEDKRATSLATYHELKTRLWEEYRRLKGADVGNIVVQSRAIVAIMAEIRAVEAEITKIEGTQIKTIDITSKGEQLVDPRSLSDAELATRLAKLLPAAQAEG